MAWKTKKKTDAEVEVEAVPKSEDVPSAASLVTTKPSHAVVAKGVTYASGYSPCAVCGTHVDSGACPTCGTHA